MNSEQIPIVLSHWQVCRTCLTMQHLYPIFLMPEHSDKYTEIIYKVTGVKVELNDDLPKHMCSICMYYINDVYKFQKKCNEVNMELLGRLKTKQYHNIRAEKLYTTDIRTTCIDISDMIITDSDGFDDCDDNLPLEMLQNSDEMKQNSKEGYEQDNFIDNKDDQKRIIKKKERAKRGKKKEENKTEREKESVECKYCHKILTSKLSLRNHYKIHTGFDVVCEHCGKKFITRRLLLMHCRAKHGYEKTDKCSYCDYRASNAEQVKIHERVHTGEKPFVCAECGASFHRRSSYLQHVAIHLPEKTVQCQQCPARFKSVTLMRIHASRHRAAQYTFKCRVCGNNFARRRNVVRHLQRVHRLPPDQHHVDRVKIT